MQIRMFGDKIKNDLVLIVSPDPTQRFILKTYLGKTPIGKSVAEVDSVDAAIRLIRTNLNAGLQFSSIIIDRDAICNFTSMEQKAWDEYMAQIIKDIHTLEKTSQRYLGARITIFSQSPESVCAGADAMLPQPFVASQHMKLLKQEVSRSLGSVLIIDDEQANHLVLNVKIKACKVPLTGGVHSAFDANAAILMVEERLKTGSNYPVIILDREMPFSATSKSIVSEAGIYVAEAIRKLEDQYAIPPEQRAYVTCFSTRVTSLEECYPGTNTFLEKPFIAKSSSQLKEILSLHGRGELERNESKVPSPVGGAAAAARDDIPRLG